jgi:adenosylcobyric acid synthase
LRLQWVRSPADLVGLKPSDWIILPGSKHTSGDLAWLRAQGLDAAIALHAQQGGAVLGICGGLQMLGEALIDPHGIDGNAPGLGLLPLVTVFETDKTVRHTQACFSEALKACTASPFAPLAGVTVAGYEIHHGQTQQHAGMVQVGAVAHVALPNGLGWHNAQGNILGVYVHGLFEDAAAVQALFGAGRVQPVPTLDSVFEGLADYVQAHFEPSVLDALIS